VTQKHRSHKFYCRFLLQFFITEARFADRVENSVGLFPSHNRSSMTNALTTF